MLSQSASVLDEVFENQALLPPFFEHFEWTHDFQLFPLQLNKN